MAMSVLEPNDAVIQLHSSEDRMQPVWGPSEDRKDVSASFEISPIGYVHSTLKNRKGAPRQGWEGAPDAELEIDAAYLDCLDGIQAGQEVWILTWLHEARRSVQKVHPR